MKLDVFIVSVDYNDYLAITLKNNINYLQNIHIITTSKDTMCQKICKKLNVHCIVTDEMYKNNEKFNKSIALNYALSLFDDLDYVLFLDADILILDEINFNELEEDAFHHALRRYCTNYESFLNIKDINEYPVDSMPSGDGFFQLVNNNNIKIEFPETQSGVGGDADLRRKYKKWKFLDNKLLHLGDPLVNWYGRISDKFISDDEINKIINNEI